MATKPKPKQHIVQDTELSAADAEIMRAFIDAKRCGVQADTVIRKLQADALRIARANPKLMVDGARITIGYSKVWKYSPAMKGFQASVKEEQKKEQESGLAKSTTGFFPIVKELAKFTGQTIKTIPETLWTRLFPGL